MNLDKSFNVVQIQAAFFFAVLLFFAIKGNCCAVLAQAPSLDDCGARGLCGYG